VLTKVSPAKTQTKANRSKRGPRISLTHLAQNLTGGGRWFSSVVANVAIGLAP